MKKVFFLVLVSLIISCEKEIGIIKDNSTIISFDYKVEDQHDLFSSVKTYEPILLETTDQSIIVNLNKLVIAGSIILTCDMIEGQVLAFDDQGSFLQAVGTKGKGPGEYIESRDITVNEELNELYVLDYKKIHTYDLTTFEYKNTIEIDFDNKAFYNPSSCANVGKDHFIFWNTSPDSYEPHKEDAYNLISFKNGKYEYFDPYQGNTDVTNTRFTKTSDGKVLIRPPYSSFEVFEWKNNNPTIKYKVEVPKPIPASEIKYTGTQFVAYHEKDFDKGLVTVLETENFLYFTLFSRLSNVYYVLYNKKKGEIVDNYGKRHKDFPTLFSSDGQHLYGYLFPYSIIDRHNQQENIDDFNPFFYSKLDIEKLDNSMNPILFKISFK